MDPSSQFVVPTIIDVPELIVTNDDIDLDDSTSISNSVWLSKLQFLASALSYNISLGNLCRFPHLCYKHGGGAFLFAYTLAMLTIGLPLFLMELAFGQYANEGPITIWRISPAFEGLGYSMCLISAMVAVYYNVVNSWILHYLLASFTFGDLPWSKCNNSWNSAQCFLKPDHPIVNCTSVGSSPSSNSTGPAYSNSSILFLGNCSATKIDSYQFERIINSTDEVTLPVNEYFHNNVLNISQSITELGQFNWFGLLGLVTAWLVVFGLILRGFRIPIRVGIITLILPYLVLTVQFLRALTLPGSASGISRYLTIEWFRLQNIDIWADATTQIFFSLAPCWGGIITLANMNKFHNNFHNDTMLICAINYATSLFAGLATFALLGHMSNYSGIAFNEVADVGFGLIFQVFPEGLSKLPLANLNSILFFAILLYIGFSSQLNVIETVITTIVDTWPHKLRYRKPLVLMILCAIMFVFSLTMCFGNGFHVLQLLDNFAATYTAMIVAILELIAIAWVYGVENFIQDIDDMISVHRNLYPSRAYWYFMWRYLTPSILFSILLFCFTDLPSLSYRGMSYPSWTTKFGWLLTVTCLSIIPAVAFVRFLLSPSGSFMNKISYLCRPSEDWAPSSYLSGPKLLGRHMMDDRNLDSQTMGHSDNPRHGLKSGSYHRHNDHQAVLQYDENDQDRSDDESNEEFKVVNGRANYIIPEEEDDTDTGLITNDTNL